MGLKGARPRCRGLRTVTHTPWFLDLPSCNGTRNLRYRFGPLGDVVPGMKKGVTLNTNARSNHYCPRFDVTTVTGHDEWATREVVLQSLDGPLDSHCLSFYGLSTSVHLDVVCGSDIQWDVLHRYEFVKVGLQLRPWTHPFAE